MTKKHKSLKTLKSLVGRTGILTNETGPNYRVEIVDVKVAFNRLIYVVCATDGDGSEKNVNADRVELDD